MVDLQRLNKKGDIRVPFTEDEFTKIVNHNLCKKEDILIINTKIVPESFTVMNTFERTYTYRIVTTKFSLPILKNRVWFLDKNLNIEDMREASRYMIGTHDFTTFRAQYKNRPTESINIREMTDISITEHKIPELMGSDLPYSEINITFRAPRFLYHQVRIMVGFLVKVGMGILKPEDIHRFLLNPRVKEMHNFMAPPQGLYLVNVKDEYE
jgi:tRNA pseudouridine38-40 synthase